MRTTTSVRHVLKGPRRFVTVAVLGVAASGCAALPTSFGVQLAGTAVNATSNGTNGALVPAGAVPALSTTMLGRFAPVYMGTHWNFTQAQAVAVAQNFNVIAAQASVFPKFVSAMKAANPNVRIVAYVNGMFDLSSGGTSYPISWYAHDAKGNRIRSTFGNYLLNPANPLWAATIAKQCSDAIARSHYDGCFLDTLGTAPLDPGYTTGLPINPATGQVWTTTAWLQATSGIARTTQAANVNAVIMDNGLLDGRKYYLSPGSTEPLIAATHVGMVELWLRSNGTPANKFRTEAQWLQDVDMLINAQAQGFTVATTTKLWVSASSAQQTQWQKYALASFLLAANGRAYFSFMPSDTDAGLIYDSSWDHVNVGTPTSAFAKVGGLYRRTFANGIAAVNPTGSSATISLGGSYRNLAGQTVTSETLPPDTGDVFIKA